MGVKEGKSVYVCVTEGAIVPERHNHAIFHLARQPRTAISAMVVDLNHRERMDKDMEKEEMDR